MSFSDLKDLGKKIEEKNIALASFKKTDKTVQSNINTHKATSANKQNEQKTHIPNNKKNNQYNSNPSKKNYKNTLQETSKAPYNFVPLNKKVVLAECKDPDKYDFFNCFNYRRKSSQIPEKTVSFSNTGYIDLEIETLGDIFIGHKNECSDFFSINNILHIPGSSIRGLIRTYVEILSFGKFGFFDDRHLYFRTFAGNSKSLRDLYSERTRGKNYDLKSKIYKHVKAGYLKKEGPLYYIYPAITDKGLQYQRYNKKHFLQYFQWQRINDEKYIIRSGPKFGQRKHEDTWVINPISNDKTKRIKLSDYAIKSFRNDLKRGGDKDKDGFTDLIAQLDNADNKNISIPCFYVKGINDKKEEFISFGHTKLFRLMYFNTLLKCIPDTHFKNAKYLDIAEAIFGRGEETFTGDKIKQLAGRIFFEDAKSKSKLESSILSEKRLRLLGPNPTCIQHYLVQKTMDKNKLSHYDSEKAKIRGNKLYWHKKTKYQTQDFNEKLDSKIKPVKQGMEFKGKIRFENLSNVELGALLSALQLPKGCFHKIGMGKSKGLGSINIKPTLFLDDRKKRYTKLFSGLNNDFANDSAFQDFCNTFNHYVLKYLGEENIKNLWETNRLTQFKYLLTLNHGIFSKKIEDQELQDFKQKKVLDIPESIIRN